MADDDDHPLHRLEEKIERMEAAARDIAERTRQAHEVLRSVKVATKELRRAEADVREAIAGDVRTVIEQATAAELEQFKTAVTEGMRAAEQQIEQTFRRLMDGYLGQEAGVALSLPDFMAARARLKAAGLDPRATRGVKP